jgi:hypothetical protein
VQRWATPHRRWDLRPATSRVAGPAYHPSQVPRRRDRPADDEKLMPLKGMRNEMNSPLRMAAAAAMGVGFIFTVPTVVVNADCCVANMNPAALQACRAGEALGGSCPGGQPGPQAPVAALPAPAPVPAAPPGPAAPWVAPPGAPEPPPMPVLAPPPPQGTGVPCGPTDTIAKADGTCGR